jgi:hypothetical protein
MLLKHRAPLIYTHDGKYSSPLVYLEYNYFYVRLYMLNIYLLLLYPECGMFSVFGGDRGSSYLRQLAVWALRLGQILFH